MSEEKSKIDELKEKMSLFFDKVGTLTKVQRLLICLATFLILCGGSIYFVLLPNYEELKRVEKVYQNQLDKLKKYKKRAAQINKYEKMMAQTQEEFNKAMQALPDKREVPALLTSVSRAGSKAGLSFYLFQPNKEVNKEFYKEIPVSIKVEGRYHQITDFFFQITRLNRIVNINNVNIKKKKGGKLEMSCKAVTYMFVEKKKEINKNKRKRKKK
ncbi:MAG: type 4a pilus biogenesis protein PilO [Desulfobacteraceae bacterium]|nr:type 4a pilus biogenesis protein PilO [Desulfobacteraceae bacterium]